MAWLRVDDKMPRHPKVAALTPLAELLHMRALCYCAEWLTDGFLPESALAELGRGFERYGVQLTELAEELEANAIPPSIHPSWEKATGGWALHDYLVYNPTREQVTSLRTVRSEAGRTGGTRSGETRRSKSEAKAKQPPKQLLRGSRDSSRGTRWPVDFRVKEEMTKWALQDLGLTAEEIRMQTSLLRDWALSKGAVKSDWEATWRNWMRRYVTEHGRPARRTPLLEPSQTRGVDREREMWGTSGGRKAS